MLRELGLERRRPLLGRGVLAADALHLGARLGDAPLQLLDPLRALVGARAALVGGRAGHLQLRLQRLQPRCQLLGLAAGGDCPTWRAVSISSRSAAWVRSTSDGSSRRSASARASASAAVAACSSAASSPAASAARRSSASSAVGGRGGRPGLLQLLLQRRDPVGVAGCRGGVGRRPLLELELELEQRLLEDRDAALGRLGIEPLGASAATCSAASTAARASASSRSSSSTRSSSAPGAASADAFSSADPQLDDLAFQRHPAGVALGAAILERRDLRLEIDRAALQLLGLAGLLLERRDARLHVLGVDLARRLGPQVGQHALELGAPLVGTGRRLAQRRDLRLALLHLRLQRLAARPSGRRRRRRRVESPYRRRSRACAPARPPGRARPPPRRAARRRAARARELRLELADAGDRLGVDRGEVDAGLVGGERPLPGHELRLALREEVLGLLQELLRLLADADLDLFLVGSRLAVVDDAAQAPLGASGLGQLLQPGMDISRSRPFHHRPGRRPS